MLVVHEGATFCIADDSGDVVGGTDGLYADDTRFLSMLRLTVAGVAPLRLSGGSVEYFSADVYLRNPAGDGLAADTLLIRRERFVASSLCDTIIVQNLSGTPVETTLELEIATDFADILTVKANANVPAPAEHHPPLPPARAPETVNGAIRIDDPDSAYFADIEVAGSWRLQGNRIVFDLAIPAHGVTDLRIEVVPSTAGSSRLLPERHFGAEAEHVREALAAWRLRVPRLVASWQALDRTFHRSVSDLASLRMRASDGSPDRLPAAGLPWFMAVFGRDTIITSLQTLLLGPELARTALEVLAELQADRDDPSIDAEPGKIVHEVRRGRATETWFSRYYGTVDATPLYLVLLSETWRWTGDDELVRRLWPNALRALAWIDEFGDRDGDGFVEYARRTDRGLENQSWKDSHDSQRFADGRLAAAPIAPCEVQGYVFDARLRMAELARSVMGDAALATTLEDAAAALARRFDEAYWVERRGGYYALALDAAKQPVDSLCSNIGHLLWSGIVPPHRVDAIVDRLFSDTLWSGWGIRTMATEDAGYSPLAYHNGTVWPHDTGLAAWGLARAGHHDRVQQIGQRLFEAAEYFNFALPEVFAGLAARDTRFPVEYPTASRPQAWSAGAPILLLRLLLGLEPDVTHRTLTTTSSVPAPEWLGEIRLDGVRAFDRPWSAHLHGGVVQVTGSTTNRSATPGLPPLPEIGEAAS